MSAITCATHDRSRSHHEPHAAQQSQLFCSKYLAHLIDHHHFVIVVGHHSSQWEKVASSTRHGWVNLSTASGWKPCKEIYKKLCVFRVTGLSSSGRWAKVHWGRTWKEVSTPPRSTWARKMTASWPLWSRSWSQLSQCQRRKLSHRSCRHHKLRRNLFWGWMPTWPKATCFKQKFCGLLKLCHHTSRTGVQMTPTNSLPGCSLTARLQRSFPVQQRRQVTWLCLASRSISRISWCTRSRTPAHMAFSSMRAWTRSLRQNKWISMYDSGMRTVKWKLDIWNQCS